jgi:hypothetical protein
MSVEFLTLEDPGEVSHRRIPPRVNTRPSPTPRGSSLQRADYMQRRRSLPHIQHTVVTCMDTIKKSSEEDDAISRSAIPTTVPDLLSAL